MSVEQNYPRKWGGLNLEEFRITREDLQALDFPESEIAIITDEDLEEMGAVIRDILGIFVLPVEIENQVFDKIGR